MRHLRVQCGNTPVVFHLKDNGVIQATIHGKNYAIARDTATFADPANDLAQELQAQVLRMVAHYFTAKK